MFFLNRLIVELLSPFTCSLILLFVSLLFYVFHRRYLGILFQVIGLLILFLLGYGVVTKNQLLILEDTYHPFEVTAVPTDLREEINYIVVLGSGHVSDSRLPVTSQIGGSSLYRLVEAIRVTRGLPGASLIISGGVGYDPVPNANVVADVANILGLDQKSIIIENRPRDTGEEAIFLKPLLQKKPFVLVTSASHMVRAMDIFLQNGMHPIAAPTEYILKQHVHPPAGTLFPSTDNLNVSKRIIYEWIGSLWLKIKRIIGNSP